MNRDRIVAKAILDAQVASDGGKSIKEIMHMNKSAWYQGYDMKDNYIEKALNLIVSDRNSSFRYRVVDAGENLLVYFTCRVNGQKLQVSFHTYGFRKFKRYLKKNDTYRLVWDHESSRDSAMMIWHHFK